MKISIAFSFCGWLGLMLGILGGIQLPATAADKISFWYSALVILLGIKKI
jgi:hypothetical protein